MNFASALFALKRGHKIKRHHWDGYWQLGTDDSPRPYVEMHCGNGDVINLLKTNDVLYTLENVACDDWEIVQDWENFDYNKER